VGADFFRPAERGATALGWADIDLISLALPPLPPDSLL